MGDDSWLKMRVTRSNKHGEFKKGTNETLERKF
jgi:hypothetical protein